MEESPGRREVKGRVLTSRESISGSFPGARIFVDESSGHAGV